MKRLTLALVLLCLAAAPLRADEPGDGIRAVISDQIEAFRSGDFAQAFAFASDGIREMFVTPETFATMVERGYAMVIAPADVQYGALREDGGALWQRVLVLDRAGAWHALDYRMTEEAGAWRISGVVLLDRPGVGA